ncbi:t-SNARE [Artemisia annua]|uniref:t-SNARE n=1 Tax=Artemisia annua TaxID=35608 RepID=A0A2U1M045_ARTAN|nr:t-SNARE [Artemisia annua]
MATRNRTFMFKRYRDALKTVRLPSYTSDAGGGGPVIEMTNKQTRSYAPLSTIDPGTSSFVGTPTVGLPPAWVDVSEEIAANIQRARSKLSELSKAHAKALMPSFGDGKEDQHRIEALTYVVTDLLKKSEKRLRKLSAGGPLEDSTIRKNVQRSLATDLQSLSVELRRKQSHYLKCLQQQQKESSDGVDLEMNDSGKHSKSEDDGFDGLGFSEHQMAKLKKSEAFSMEREREIQQVGESVNELAQIMKDLSALVIDQGTIIDRIDYNIQNVAATVDEGLKQLQKVAFVSIIFFHLSPSRAKSETRGNGNVRYSTCGPVLSDVGSLNHQGDSLLILLLFNIINMSDA